MGRDVGPAVVAVAEPASALSEHPAIGGAQGPSSTERETSAFGGNPTAPNAKPSLKSAAGPTAVGATRDTAAATTRATAADASSTKKAKQDGTAHQGGEKMNRIKNWLRSLGPKDAKRHVQGNDDNQDRHHDSHCQQERQQEHQGVHEVLISGSTGTRQGDLAASEAGKDGNASRSPVAETIFAGSRVASLPAGSATTTTSTDPGTDSQHTSTPNSSATTANTNGEPTSTSNASAKTANAHSEATWAASTTTARSDSQLDLASNASATTVGAGSPLSVTLNASANTADISHQSTVSLNNAPNATNSHFSLPPAESTWHRDTTHSQGHGLHAMPQDDANASIGTPEVCPRASPEGTPVLESESPRDQLSSGGTKGSIATSDGNKDSADASDEIQGSADTSDGNKGSAGTSKGWRHRLSRKHLLRGGGGSGSMGGGAPPSSSAGMATVVPESRPRHLSDWSGLKVVLGSKLGLPKASPTKLYQAYTESLFVSSGLRRAIVELDEHTTMEAWVPKLTLRYGTGGGGAGDSAVERGKRSLSRTVSSGELAGPAASSSPPETSPSNAGSRAMGPTPGVPPPGISHPLASGMSQSMVGASPAAAAALATGGIAKPPGSKHRKSPPLVLLHGFGASAIEQWDGQVAELCRHFDVYAPNFPFFGNSFTKRPERTLDFQAECVLRLLTKLGVGRFDVLGFSYGAAIAYKIAAQYPERVRRVVIVDDGIMMNRADLVEMQQELDIDDGNGFWRLPSTPKDVRQLEEIAFSNPVWMPNFVYKDVLKVMFSKYLKEWNELIYEYTIDRPDDPTQNPVLSQKTLLVWGEDDPMAPLRFGTQLLQHLGESCRLVAIKGARHCSFAQHPKEFNKIVMDFLLSWDGSIRDMRRVTSTTGAELLAATALMQGSTQAGLQGALGAPAGTGMAGGGALPSAAAAAAVAVPHAGPGAMPAVVPAGEELDEEEKAKRRERFAALFSEAMKEGGGTLGPPRPKPAAPRPSQTQPTPQKAQIVSTSGRAAAAQTGSPEDGKPELSPDPPAPSQDTA